MKIEEFPLAWRWTDSKYSPLPVDVLSQMVPLTKEEARIAFTRGKNLRDSSGITHSAEISRPEGRVWLRTQYEDLSATVTVVWSFGWALRTSWHIFTEYWDTFCYPSSDDIAVISDSEQWVLYYDHEEQFEFVRRS